VPLGARIADLAFSHVGLDYRLYVKPDPDLYRPAEVNFAPGRRRQSRRVLGWSHHTGFEALVREMVDADCRAVACFSFALTANRTSAVEVASQLF